MVKIYINDEEDSSENLKMESDLLKIGFLYFLSDKEMMRMWTVLLPGKLKFYPDYSKYRPLESVDLSGYFINVPKESHSIFFGDNYYPIYLTKKDVTLVCYSRTCSDQKLWAEGLNFAVRKMYDPEETSLSYETFVPTSKDSAFIGLCKAKVKLLKEMNEDMQDILERKPALFSKINHFHKDKLEKNNFRNKSESARKMCKAIMTDIDSYLSMFQRKKGNNFSNASDLKDVTDYQDIIAHADGGSDSDSTLSIDSTCSKSTVKDATIGAAKPNPDEIIDVKNESADQKAQLKEKLVHETRKDIPINMLKNTSTLEESDLENKGSSIENSLNSISSKNKITSNTLVSNETKMHNPCTLSNTEPNSCEISEDKVKLKSDQADERQVPKLKRRKAIYLPSKELPKSNRAQSLIFFNSSSLHPTEGIVSHLRGRARLLKDRKFTSTRSKSVDPTLRYSEENFQPKKEWFSFLDIAHVKKSILSN